MKKTALIFLFALISVSLFAQIPNFGPKIGITSSQLSSDLDDYTQESILGYQFGAFARLNFGKIYLQPEAYYTKKGGELNFKPSINPDFEIKNKIKLNTLDVPLLLGYKVLNLKVVNVRLNAGPVASFVLNKNVEVHNNNIDFKSGSTGEITKDDIKDAIWGFQAGVGVDVLMFTIDVRAEWGINDISNVSDMESKSNLYYISIGYKLF
ncbi:MAG: PorT family protein [Bacteroidales bacterium]|nr:PorT family protein [Bacteroidales bacterium]